MTIKEFDNLVKKIEKAQDVCLQAIEQGGRSDGKCLFEVETRVLYDGKEKIKIVNKGAIKPQEMETHAEKGKPVVGVKVLLEKEKPKIQDKSAAN